MAVVFASGLQSLDKDFAHVVSWLIVVMIVMMMALMMRMMTITMVTMRMMMVMVMMEPYPSRWQRMQVESAPSTLWGRPRQLHWQLVVLHLSSRPSQLTQSLVEEPLDYFDYIMMIDYNNWLMNIN